MYKDSNHYTLYKRDKYWGYYYYDNNNKRHFRSTGCKTKYEAQKVITERIKADKLSYKDYRKNVKLKEFAQDFFLPGKCPILKESKRTGRELSESTRRGYRAKLEKVLLPRFGDYLLSSITDEEIKDFEEDLSKKGYKYKTINSILFPLRSILNQAVLEDRIEKNPFEKISRLKDEESTRKAFTFEQVKKILYGGPWKHEISRLSFKMACVTGLRIGEIQALRCSILKEGDTIKISESYSEQCTLFKDTKNHKTRYIPFPEDMRSDLEYLASGKNDDELLFSINGRTVWQRGVTRRDMKERMQEEGINDPDLTFHSCRYFFNSYLYLKSGIDKERIMSVTGHSSEDMFRHYLSINKGKDLDPIREAQSEIAKN